MGKSKKVSKLEKNTHENIKKNIEIEKNQVITSEYLIKRKQFNWFERVSQVFAIIILAVFPLVINDSYYDITDFKFNMFLFFSIIYFSLCAIILCCFLSKDFRTSRLKGGLQRLTIPQIAIIIYMLWAIISSICSKYASDVWIGQSRYEGLCSLLIYGLIFVFLSYWGEYSNIYVYALSIMAAILSFMCVLQLCNINIIYPSGYSFVNTYFLGTIGHSDCVSGIIAIIVPVLTCAFILFKHKIWRYLYLIVASALLFILLSIGVDSGKIGLAAAFICVLPYLLDAPKKICRTLIVGAVFSCVIALTKVFSAHEGSTIVINNPQKSFWIFMVSAIAMGIVAFVLSKKVHLLKWNAKKLRRIFAVIIGIIVIAVIFILYAYNGNNELLSDISQILHGNLSDTAGNCRGYIWKSVFALILQNPIIGTGPGTLLKAFEPYNAGYQQYYPSTVIDFAHNDFLQIGLCVGFVGLAIYLGFIITLFVRAIKSASRCPIIIVLLSGIIGYLGHVFFGFSIAIVTPLFWVLAGLLDKCIRQLPKITIEETK